MAQSVETLPQLITAEQLAARLGGGLTAVRVYRLARRRLLPSVRLGASVRFDPCAVAKWIERGGGTVADTDDAA